MFKREHIGIGVVTFIAVFGATICAMAVQQAIWP